MNFKNPEGQVAKWLEFLSSFDMKIEHHPGRSHKNGVRVITGLDRNGPDRR